MRYLVWLLLLALPAFAQGERSLKIFQLSNRPAEATVEMVRPLLSPEGTVMAETRLNKLVVQDTPEALSRVEQLLEEIDQPAPQVRIKVSMQGVNPTSNSRVGVAASGTNHQVRVAGTAQSTTATTTASSEQNLLVMSGERGVIMVGRDLVQVAPGLAGWLPAGVVVQSVSTGFAVEPRVMGDVVRLTISPWMGYVGSSGRGEVVVNEASTSLTLKSGDSAVISSGSFSQQAQANAFGLILGTGSGSSTTSGSIVVQPVIEPDWSSPD